MAEALLSVRSLTRRFGGLIATDRLDLDVARGGLHALIGPNGAGKTTLVHQISGALAPEAGRIVFCGEDVTRFAMHARVRRGLARSYQATSIFGRFSVLDNVALAVQARSGSSLGFWRPAIAEARLFDEAGRVVARVGLEGRAGEIAASLAHGDQRRLEIALALATAPKLLLLDEPLAGMGAEESRAMERLLAELKREATVLLVEHDMDAVFRLADTISVLVSGRVIATGPPAEIRAHPEVRRAYLGEGIAA